jgi:amino acid transporter
MGVSGTMFVYLMTCFSVLRLRRLGVAEAGTPFVIPGGPVVPVAALLAVVWLFYETVSGKDGGDQLKGMLIALVVIFALYGLRALRNKLRPQATVPAK